ncbi:MAG: hypothetical protein WCP69_07345 [Bacteroidota bacterium]
MKKTIFLLCLLPFLAQSQITLPVKKITIYKNSTGMVMKQGLVKKSNGKFVITSPTNALLGTYWIATGKDFPIKNVYFNNDTVKLSTSASTNALVLQNSIGRDVTFTITYSDKSEKIISGKLLSYFPETNMVKVKQDNGKTNFFNASGIVFMEFAGDTNPIYLRDSLVKSAIIEIDKGGESQNVVEYYMQEGFNWIPSYFLRIINDKEARLEMKATIENYSEPLNDVDCELVVGSPQLYFGKQNDPMTYGWITSINQKGVTYNNDNAMSNMQVQTAYRQEVDGSNGLGYAADVTAFETEGEKNNDLFYYQIGKISLPKGTKGFFPIFATNLAFSDRYKADIPDKNNMSYTGYCDNSENFYDVFHSLDLKNTTSYPFTTASVMVISDKGQFMAQDLFKYTPVGGMASIRLSKAIDIQLKNVEEELVRTDNAKRIGKTMYSKATVKGTVSISNMQQKPVIVDVKKNTAGTVLNNGGATVHKKRVNGLVNPQSELEWSVSLAAGEKKTLTYEFEVYFISY